MNFECNRRNQSDHFLEDDVIEGVIPMLVAVVVCCTLKCMIIYCYHELTVSHWRLNLANALLQVITVKKRTHKLFQGLSLTTDLPNGGVIQKEEQVYRSLEHVVV